MYDDQVEGEIITRKLNRPLWRIVEVCAALDSHKHGCISFDKARTSAKESLREANKALAE